MILIVCVSGPGYVRLWGERGLGFLEAERIWTKKQSQKFKADSVCDMISYWGTQKTNIKGIQHGEREHIEPSSPETSTLLLWRPPSVKHYNTEGSHRGQPARPNKTYFLFSFQTIKRWEKLQPDLWMFKNPTVLRVRNVLERDGFLLAGNKQGSRVWAVKPHRITNNEEQK